MTDGIKRGLVLPGGGARGAYQVGVLTAVAEVLGPGVPSPFQVISGTSAGGINAVVLAARAARFDRAAGELERVWANFHAGQVYRTDTWTMLRSSLHWMLAMMAGGLRRHNPRSLLDNSPLKELLAREIRFSRIARTIQQGHLDAVAVTAAAYGVGRSVTFYQGRPDIRPWSRVRRRGQPTVLTLDHVLASAAVPVIFPPRFIRGQWYADGAIRQAAPLSPAVHMGSERILVIGVRDEQPDPEPGETGQPRYPSFGEITGYLLDSLFLDSLYTDLERLTRINQMLDQLPPDLELTGPPGRLRRIDTLIITPSRDVREIAARHAGELPLTIRMLLRGLGADNQGGRQLLSYLLFESGFTRELIGLGYRDAMAMREDLEAFLFAPVMDRLDAPEPLRRGLLQTDDSGEAVSVA